MSSSATDPGNRSSAEIERDVVNTRARLSGTLDELRDRTQPGQLLEQVLDYAKQSGGADLARNLGQQMRDNPLPLLLIGAGIGWLMMGNNAQARGTPSHGRQDAGGASLTDRAAHAAGSATDRVGEAAGSLRDSIAGAVDSAGQAIGDAYHRVADAAGSAADSASGGMRQARERATHLGGDARDGVRNGMGWLVSEQPLVLGAIGLAVGAAVGALLPGTDAEDRLMGETRDRLVGQAQATAEQGYERVKQTAGEQVDQVKQRLDQSGLSADRLADAVGDAARQVKEAVNDTTRDAADRAKGALDDGQPGRRGVA